MKSMLAYVSPTMAEPETPQSNAARVRGD